MASFILTGAFFAACGKTSESFEDGPENKSKSLNSEEKFKVAENQLNPKNASELIDEVSNSLPETVAIVNGINISNWRVKKSLNRLKGLAGHTKKTLNKGQIQNSINKILDIEIMREVAIQKGQELKIDVSDIEIDKRLTQLKSRHSSDEEFFKELSKSGNTLERIKKEIKRDIMIFKLIKTDIHNKIKISDQQAQDYYEKNKDIFKNSERVRASHILTQVTSDMNDSDKKNAKKKMEDVLQKAKAGEDFAELAKKYSEGPSASRGGDLNYIEKGQMVKNFEDVVFKLKVGEISGIVETQFGYHIIKVFDKKEASGFRPFNEVKKRIVNNLKKKEAEKRTKSYIDKIMKESDIKRLI